MTVIDNNDTNHFYFNACIAMIWCMAAYSLIIQQKYLVIPNFMLIIGGLTIFTYVLANSGKIALRKMITQENELMVYYLVYMLIFGYVFSPSKNNHLSQWVTCLEYLSLQIIISSIIKESGTNVFNTLLLVISIILAGIFIKQPVNFLNSGRYSISNEYNPNGLGMAFTAGIWASLYLQQKKGLPLFFIGVLIALFGYCIFMTGSRKALIAAGMIIIPWIPFSFIPSLKKRGLLSGIAALLCLLILGVVIAPRFMKVYTDSTIAARMDNLLFEAQEGNRSNMYRQGFELLKRNPLFGLGFQGFAYYYGSYSHSTIVEVPASGGILGAILYFSAYVVSTKKMFTIYAKTKNMPEFSNEHNRIKMILLLWAAMLFYTVCIIHPYQFDSAILFGIIFGETAYIEKKLVTGQEAADKKIQRRSKYIRYE